MGGSSGALYTIGLTAGARALEAGSSYSASNLTVAMAAGVDAISQYGGAVEGDCTMLDVLYPLLRTLQVHQGEETSALATMCIQAVETGVLKTKALKPRAGRAAYICTVETEGLSDPGGMLAATWVRAISRQVYGSTL
eukprot:sb/3474483/